MTDQDIRISTIIVTYKRDEALINSLERLREIVSGRQDHELILVDNNADEVGRQSLLSAFSKGRLVRCDQNLGVAAGRNAGIAAAKGDILVFIDDDALLDGGPDLYDTLLSRFDREPVLAALAFRSWMRERGASDPIEFPHTDKSLSRDEPFETFRFIGVGHALRRVSIDEVGTYRESFFYGMEEFEMCFRLLERGWRIRYDPAFTVTHMKATSGRLPSKEVMQRMFTNKLCIAWMHLPAKELALCASAWTVKTLVDSRSPMTVLKALAAFTKIIFSRTAKRQPKRFAVDRIVDMGGIAWR